MLNVAALRLRFYIIRASWLKQFQPFIFVLTSNSGLSVPSLLLNFKVEPVYLLGLYIASSLCSYQEEDHESGPYFTKRDG